MPLWTPNDAYHTAKRYLRGMEPRWTHVQSAAERAMELAPLCWHDLDTSDLAISAVWLHDVGYSASLVVTGFHPLDGAIWLRDQGQLRLAGLVAYHTDALEQATDRGLLDELRQFTDERSSVSRFVSAIDATTGHRGQVMTVEARVAEVAERYGEDHPVTLAIRTCAMDLRRDIRWMDTMIRRDQRS